MDSLCKRWMEPMEKGHYAFDTVLRPKIHFGVITSIAHQIQCANGLEQPDSTYLRLSVACHSCAVRLGLTW